MRETISKPLSSRIAEVLGSGVPPRITGGAESGEAEEDIHHGAVLEADEQETRSGEKEPDEANDAGDGFLNIYRGGEGDSGEAEANGIAEGLERDEGTDDSGIKQGGGKDHLDHGDGWRGGR